MKKLLFFIVGIITIISCNEPNEINYEQEILGLWACDYIDGKANSTQSFHIIHFQDNNKLQWSEGVESESGKTDWHKHPAFSYRVTENVITYEGQDAQGNLINAELSINSITETSLTYYIKKLTINNTNISDNKLYKLKKISSENPQLEGIWFGKEVSPGTQTHDYYWQFFNDGKFDFYYYNEATGKYKKGNMNGHYTHYGDIIIMHSNAPIIDKENYSYDAWHITEKSAENMHWMCKTHDGTNVSFMLTHTTELPEIE